MSNIAERVWSEPYPAYKASGVPWLEKVPEHWDVRRFRTIAIGFRNGITDLQLESGVTAHLVSRIETISDGVINYTKVGYLTGESKHQPYLLEPDDFLISHINSYAKVGNSARYKGEKSLVHGMNLIRVTPLDSVVPAFLDYMLKSEVFLGAMRRACKPAINQVSVTTTAIKAIPFPFPPTHEQAAIARFLDHADEQIQRYISGKERLIALLEEERQAVIHQAVTQGLDPNVRLKPSGVEWLGKVPEHWEVARFARQVNIAEGQVDPKIEPYASMLMIAPNHVESGTGRLLSRETASEQGSISGKYFCRAGDVVYSKIRPALAKVSVAPTDCLCSADMYPLRPRNSLQRDYLFWLLLSTGFTAWSVLQSDRVAMPKINRQTLNNVHIPLPPLSEQVSIVRHLIEATAKASGAIDRAHRQIDLMNEYRTRLIADVVTGQLDVREAAEELPTPEPTEITD